MRTFLKAIPRNFHAAYFSLCMPAALLGWAGHASATEPVVIHGSDTFTFEITSVRLKREQIQLVALDAVVGFVFDSGNRLTEQHFLEERH